MIWKFEKPPEGFKCSTHILWATNMLLVFVRSIISCKKILCLSSVKWQPGRCCNTHFTIYHFLSLSFVHALPFPRTITSVCRSKCVERVIVLHEYSCTNADVRSKCHWSFDGHYFYLQRLNESRSEFSTVPTPYTPWCTIRLKRKKKEQRKKNGQKIKPKIRTRKPKHSETIVVF